MICTKNALRMAWFGMALFVFCGLSNLATAQTWTSLAPTPTGNTLNDAYSPDGGTTTYFVGDAGTILKRTGSTVTFMTSGTTAPIKGIHGRSATDIWAVGGNGAAATVSDPTRSVLLHFNGTTWTATTPPTVQGWDGLYTMADVWVSATGGAYAISDLSGAPAKWNAAQSKWEFEGVTDPLGVVSDWGFRLESIFGFSDSDIFAVGTYGTILHRDATGWTVMAQLEAGGSMSFNLLQAVWGPDADNVFASGNSGQIFRLKRSVSPTTWVQVNTGGGILDGYDLSAMSGSGANDIWFVGLAGVIRQWVGTNNALVNRDDPAMKARHAIVPASGGYLLGGDYGLMESMNGTTGARQTLNTPAKITTNLKAAVFTDRLWIVPEWTGQSIGIYAWNGGQMTAHPIATLAENSFTKTFKGFSASDMWLSVIDTATMNGLTLRGNGSSWTAWTPPGSVGSSPPLLDVAKTASGGYAVLQDANGNGSPCMVESTFMNCLNGGIDYYYKSMAASPNGDVHAVGLDGKVARWHSGAWSTSVVGANGDDLYAVAATTNMVVAVGENGAAFYSTDGASWSPVTGIPRVAPPEAGYPLYSFSSIVHAGGGVFWAALNTSSRYTDGNKAYLYRIQNGVGQLVEGGFSSPVYGMTASIEQNASFTVGEHGAVMTTNPDFTEVTGGSIPPMLHLLLGQ
ncbi:hypothetical protein G3N56_06430 [Desulfovibrio sulfodismutans]|uniref:Uncharacterized protein n=1 Tax=Desulfolutivibrio sulfodismutans TaxID=63561 RepID=A0A7K3NME7_9BACT|nr:hypothetical protein [Desulfolutivibrio sulfodismutans]NDY56379.1 hypothetical protein [Desulfolutivibrio sulfodismutans]QLA13450.1 hypothetical protein GD606_14855 [Desulfolutivibrio sulfodismutans DSM 3696]